MRNLIILLLLCGNLFSAHSKNCVILSISGKIEIREPYQTEWKQASENTILSDRTTIRSNQNSSAQIKTYQNEFFLLPSNAQIEIQELRKLDRNEVVLELTAFDLQKLPVQTEPTQSNNVFILHGAIKDDANIAQSQKYILLETNGALALFDQGYISGFIIKWNKLINTFPDIKSEKAQQALVESYKIMNMPKRLQEMNNSSDQKNTEQNF